MTPIFFCLSLRTLAQRVNPPLFNMSTVHCQSKVNIVPTVHCFHCQLSTVFSSYFPGWLTMCRAGWGREPVSLPLLPLLLLLGPLHTPSAGYLDSKESLLLLPRQSRTESESPSLSWLSQPCNTLLNLCHTNRAMVSQP